MNQTTQSSPTEDKNLDPVLAKLTAPGAPFELAKKMINGQELTIFSRTFPTLSDILSHARSHGDKTFIVRGDERWSFNRFFEYVDGAANWLVSQGVGKGDKVGICMKNRPEWMVSFAAIVKAGAVAVLCNSRGAGPEMDYAIGKTECKLTFVDSRCEERLKEAGCEATLVNVDEKWEEISSCVDDGLTEERADSDELAAVLFTSGTSGKAKAAMLSHRNLITGVATAQLSGASIAIRLAEEYGTTVEKLTEMMPQPATILIFPLFHISGASAVFLTNLANGGKIVMLDRWVADDAVEAIEKEKVSNFSAVPTMLWDLLSTNLEGRDLSSLRAIANGGQALQIPLLKALQKAFPNAFMGTGYGLTETAGAVSMATGNEFVENPDSAGRKLLLSEVVALDDDGNPLPTGEIGELAVRGPMVMKGYYGDENATAEAIKDGWFVTGDVGSVDEKGFVRIVDRKKDMIISGGENIYCAEVEKASNAFDAVGESAAFGIPDDRLGEALVLVVVGDDIDEDALKLHLKTELADYKQPRILISRKDPLPQNATGKVLKRELREEYAQELTEKG